MGRFGGPLAKMRTANRRWAVGATEVFCTVIPIYLNGDEVLCTEYSAVPGTIVRLDGWRRMGMGWMAVVTMALSFCHVELDRVHTYRAARGR